MVSRLVLFTAECIYRQKVSSHLLACNTIREGKSLVELGVGGEEIRVATLLKLIAFLFLSGLYNVGMTRL